MAAEQGGLDPQIFAPEPPEAAFTMAREIGDGKLSIEEIASRANLPIDAVKKAMNHPQIRGYLAAYLDEKGASLEASALVIAEAHHAIARQVVSYQGEATVVDVGPDHATRLKAAELNLKARGELRDAQQTSNIFIDLSDEQLAKIAIGELDPATLIDVGPRIINPAIEASRPPAAPTPAKISND